jgi:zinc protease
MRRALMALAFVLSCAHVPPPSTAGLPSPWLAARADAGTAPAPSGLGPIKASPGANTPHAPTVTTTPGGAVVKKGKPLPIEPLSPPIHEDFDRAKAPPAGPPPKLNLPVPVRRKLKNGAAVLIVERHQLPVLSLVVTWPTGIADEPPAQAGLAGLTADLLDEGAGSRSALELAEAVARLGARFESTSSWDATTVAATTLTRALDPLLAIVADVVARPSFADKEIERVRADRLTALVQQRDAPGMVALDTMSRLIYGERHRYGLPQLGTEAGLKSLGRADLQAWHRERLRPDLATIIVVGDVTPDDVVRRLDAAFAGWTAAAHTPLRHAAPPTATPARRVVLVDRPDAQQTEVYVGLPGAARKSKDFFACLVLNAILGGEFVSRINLNLREQHGYSYGAASRFSFRREGGPFSASAPVKTAVTGPSLKELLTELGRVRTSDVSAEELRLAKDLLERALAAQFETPPQVASTLVAQVAEGLPDDYYKTYAEHIEKVTIADVRRAASKWIDAAKAAIVLVGDEAQIGASVKAVVGDYERRSSDGAPLAQKP